MPRSYDKMSREELVEALHRLEADPRVQAPDSETGRALHDLQVHQIELEMQNRELREAQLLLEESRSRYADLYDYAPVVYFTLDRDGRILDANLTASTLFKVPRGVLVGMPLAALVSMENQRDFRTHLSRCFTEKVRVTSELAFSIQGSRPVVAQMVSTPVVGPDETVTGCKTTLTDISALKRTEELLRFVARVSAALGSSFDHVATLAETVRLGVPVFADICFLDLLERDGRLRRVEVAFADPRKQYLADAVRHLVPSATGNSPQAHVLRSGEPILLAEATVTGLHKAIADGLEHETLIRACRASSLMFVPLIGRQGACGVATFVMAESGRRYSSSDLLIAQDLAARAAMAIDNAHLYEEAQSAIQAREDILSIVSHDLKNPLAIIMLSAAVLSHASAQWGPPKGQKQLDMIQRAARQMQRIIDDLLDVSRIETGRLSVEQSEHDMHDLMRDACEALGPLAAEKGLNLACKAPTGSVRVLCDRERVHQVLSNLVGNAIKFTPAGGSIAISVDAHDLMARVAIQDTGPGIPEALLPNVFTRRWQAQETSHKGLGLGLHITRGLVEAQGGTIWVESQPGAGTTFFFTMPVASSEDEDERESERARERGVEGSRDRERAIERERRAR